MRNLPLAIALLAMASTTASAATLQGVKLADTTQVDGQTLPLNGMGLRSKLMVKVYVAGLYVAPKSSDAEAILKSDAPKRMVLQFLREVSREQMVEAYEEAFAANAPASKSSLAKDIQSLMAAFEPVKAGDQMVFTYVPGKGTEFAINGKSKVTLAGQPFAQAMFACWIGPVPPSADFKAGVLGK
jgi:hypothetical protein